MSSKDCPQSPNGNHEPKDTALADADGDAPMLVCRHCGSMIG